MRWLPALSRHGLHGSTWGAVMAALAVFAALPAAAETQHDASDEIAASAPAGAALPEPFPNFAGLNYRIEVPLRRDRATRDALVFEHGAPWRFGDSYLFLKVTELLIRAPEDDPRVTRSPSGVYAEWHPRVRLSHVLGRGTTFGPVRELTFASQVTISGTGTRTHAHGLGVDLAIPTAYLARAQVYLRNDPAYPGISYKALFVSLHAMEVAGLRFRGTVWLEGHTAEADDAPTVSAQLQLHADLGHALFRAAGHFFGGVIVDIEREWLPAPDATPADFTARIVVRWRS